MIIDSVFVFIHDETVMPDFIKQIQENNRIVCDESDVEYNVANFTCDNVWSTGNRADQEKLSYIRKVPFSNYASTLFIDFDVALFDVDSDLELDSTAFIRGIPESFVMFGTFVDMLPESLPHGYLQGCLHQNAGRLHKIPDVMYHHFNLGFGHSRNPLDKWNNRAVDSICRRASCKYRSAFNRLRKK